MTEELTKTEARQGDKRQTNMRVLFWSLPAALIILVVVFLIWAR